MTSSSGAKPGWRKDEFLNGVTAYSILCVTKPDKPLLIHFGLGQYNVVLCGRCMATQSFSDHHTLHDVGLWCFLHWKTSTSMIKSEMMHELKDVPRRKPLLKLLMDSIGVLRNESQRLGKALGQGEPMPFLLDQYWLKRVFAASIMKAVTRSEPPTLVCNQCLKPNGNGICCPNARMIEVSRLTLCTKEGPLLSTPSRSILLEQKCIHGNVRQAIVDASSEAPTTPSRSSAPVATSFGSPLSSSPVKETASTFSTPKSPSASVESSLPLVAPSPAKSLTVPNRVDIADDTAPTIVDLLLAYEKEQMSAAETMEQVRRLILKEAHKACTLHSKRIRPAIEEDQHILSES